MRRRAAPRRAGRALRGRHGRCGSGVAAPGQPHPAAPEGRGRAAPLLRSRTVPPSPRHLRPCCRRPACPAPSPPLSRCHPGPAAAPSPLMAAGEAGAPRRCCRFRAAAAGSGARLPRGRLPPAHARRGRPQPTGSRLGQQSLSVPLSPGLL